MNVKQNCDQDLLFVMTAEADLHNAATTQQKAGGFFGSFFNVQIASALVLPHSGLFAYRARPTPDRDVWRSN